MLRILVGTLGLFVLGQGLVRAADWPRFLGTDGTSISGDSMATPVKWSDEENLKWKIDLPGRGVSSPIVVGDKVFVTCYSGYGTGDRSEKMEDLKRHLLCLHREDGRELWKKTVDAVLPEDPYSGMGIPAHGYASHTPISDGEHLFVFFGKTGVIAYDLNGNELWRESVGTGSGSKRWGSSSSPVLHGDVLIVTASDEDSAIYGFDKKSGKELWKCEAQFDDTYNTPVVVSAGDRTDLVISVPGEVWGINPESGKLRWYSRGTTDTTASASLVPADGVVYATGGRGGDAVAVKVGGKGDVNDSHVVWDANIPGRFATPVFHDGHLFTFASGIISAYDAETGDRVKQQRLSSDSSRGGGGRGGDGGGFGGRGGDGGFGGRGGFGGGGFGGRGGGMGNLDYASPVLADGKIYVTTNSGSFHVVSATPELELLATNKLTDKTGFAGTPAVSDGELFLRSHGHLYCVAETEK